uniref:FGENESH: predicted gene_5.363 protein n=1 Tax=Rhodotorula toruloides TaxID=5286 RepID=A0A0K3CEG6_RHOTO
MAGWGSLARVPGEVGTFTVLKSQPKSDEALALLKKIHAMVKPIMKKHGWFLPTLAEFYPSQENLLGINVNRGWKICLRLRPAHDPHSFLPLEDAQHCLIGTMLHELSHNVRGPHDDIFFKTMDILYDEFDQLRAKGYLGFAGEGRRVGEGVAHDGPLGMREAREKALKRMEEAERLRKLLGQGGKLGGRAPDTKGKRRGDILADKACGGDDAHNHPSGSKQEDLPAEIQDAINQADRDSRRVVIDLTNLSDSEDEVEPAPRPSSLKRAPSRKARESSSSSIEVEVIRKRPKIEDDESTSSSLPSRASTSSASSSSSRSAASSRSSASSAATSSSKPARPRPPSRSTQSTSPPGAWSCQLCTYRNPSPLSLACEICRTERPASTLVGASLPPIVGRGAVAIPERLPRFGSARMLDNGIGWSCHVCSTLNEDIFWCCSMCQTCCETYAPIPCPFDW